ncbi:MAG: hypothetical protein COA42_18280 [Alteromonadaceae bacterium]|nr:MAG: hypothetical protein COA42_18280 [Alteromonadaceae bacterium]
MNDKQLEQQAEQQTEIKQAITAMEQFIREQQPSRKDLLKHLRESPLPFIPWYCEQLGPAQCFALCFEFLQALGRYNVALAVGLSMNQYMAFSIACLPVAPGSALAGLKQQFKSMVLEQRWILAVSSFDDFLRHQQQAKAQVQCRLQEDGSVICDGLKNFQSNITEADVLLFSGLLRTKKLTKEQTKQQTEQDGQWQDVGTGLFYAFLKDTPGLSTGEPVYSGAMTDADTRTLHFDKVHLPKAQMVPVASEQEALGLHALTRVVFAVMAMAPYMGGAQRALTLAGQFAHKVHVQDQPLATLDGTVLDFGRQNIRFTVCEGLVERFCQALQTLNGSEMGEWLAEQEPKVLATKQHISAECEALVSFARKFIGTRAMLAEHEISQISQQVLFAALHPPVNAVIERELGQSLLAAIKDS